MDGKTIAEIAAPLVAIAAVIFAHRVITRHGF